MSSPRRPASFASVCIADLLGWTPTLEAAAVMLRRRAGTLRSRFEPVAAGEVEAVVEELEGLRRFIEREAGGKR